jgi:hydrogenase-4 component H
MSGDFELATGDPNDVTQSLELFMLTCRRCGRCYDMETTNVIDKLDLRGYRYDSLEARTVVRKTTDDRLDPLLLDATERVRRPERAGG